MNKIKLLDQHCINQIAAGEVVERPLSVVKELIENALDASAKNIEISVEGGGTSLIKIKDDGIGIQPEDLPLALLPHATSKITQIGDLDHLQTLGFRGEALPSIASVSKLNILSRTADSVSGHEIQVEGGKVISTTEIGCPIGTVVTIRDLFYNTPARHKFLRSATTEFGLISDMVTRIALARPDVSFTLRHPRNLIFNTPGKGDLLETIASVIGPETARKMIPLFFSEGNFGISGYISMPSLIRSSKNGITFIVNGRVIRSQLLNQALRDSYYTLIPAGTYPIAVLSITMPPSDYDVNVHPAKLEIKFRAEKELSEKITTCVKKAIQQGQNTNNVRPNTMQTNTMQANTVRVKQQEHGPQKEKPTNTVNNNHNWEQLKILYKPTGPDNEKTSIDRNFILDRASAENRKSDENSKVAENTGLAETTGLDVTQISVAEKNMSGYNKDSVEIRVINNIKDINSLKVENSLNGLNGLNGFNNVTGLNDLNTLRDLGELKDLTEKSKVLENVFDYRDNQNNLDNHDIKENDGYNENINHFFLELRAIGQLFNTYILCTDDKSLYCIDQHAAHERIKYNRLLQQVKENTLSSQLLVVPLTIDLTAQEEQLLLEHIFDLQELGFIIEHFGARTYFIRGVPLLKHLEDPGKLFQLFLDELLSNALPPNREKLLEKWIFMIACRSAIKGQDRLAIQEMDEIIQELGKTPDPYSCPHGRPTIIEITKQELDKKFYR